jgi:hypothetical protein
MFRELLAHPQEALNKHHLVYYVRFISADPELQYTRSAVLLQSLYSCHLFTLLRPRHWRTQGGVWGFKPPRNSEVLKKLGQIPSSVEYTSVTT